MEIMRVRISSDNRPAVGILAASSCLPRTGTHIADQALDSELDSFEGLLRRARRENNLLIIRIPDRKQLSFFEDWLSERAIPCGYATYAQTRDMPARFGVWLVAD